MLESILEPHVAGPTTDPDDIRRRRLLNILLLGFFLAAIGGIFVLAIDSLTQKRIVPEEGRWLWGIVVAFLVGSVGLYFVNRYSGRAAAFLLLLFLTVAFTFSDTPEQLADGRSLFLFTIPIATASLILFPAASFIFAALGSAIISWLALSISIVPNAPAIAAFFIFALLSWLSSRSLDQALRELRVINTNLDQVVTERTRELAESLTRERIKEGQSQAILGSIADGVIVFDLHRRAILANSAISNLLGIPLDRIADSTSDELIRSSPMEARERERLAHILSRPTSLASQRIEWGDKTLSVTSSQVLDAEGGLLGTVAVFRDFTREAEVERLKSTFIGMVSHELRTPLNAILGYAEMFKERVYGPVNEKQVNMSERIMTNTRRLLGLINDLLDQAQIEAGKLAIKKENVKASDLLKNMHDVMDNLIAEKGLLLTTTLDPSLPETLIGDNVRLQQILVNLVSNAVKFTDRGSVHVRFSKQKAKHWQIEVNDTGRGISQEDLPYVFDTFRQVEGAATREHGGVGLGLSIVKQLVSLMEGEIAVKSELGAGSTFSVTFPLEVP
ncbi:MAG: sensor histidine kinase [Chloroflexota bacterium]